MLKLIMTHCLHFAQISIHIDGMGAIEGEKQALADVAAFIFFTLFVLLLVLLCWAFYTLYQHFKKHGFGQISVHMIHQVYFTRYQINDYFIIFRNVIICIISILMNRNGSFGVDYHPNNDTYGNSQKQYFTF